jgi:hypothetical protein
MNRISESSTIAQSALKSFKEMISHMDKVRKLSSLELIEQVEEINPFKTLSFNHVLIDELVRRYEKATSVVRPEEEFPEPTEADLKEVEAIEAEIEANRDKVLYYVIRFDDGSFFAADKGWLDTLSLSEATHYPTREEAEMVAPVDATVVEVTP